jgi:hypothetical protein
MSRTSVQLTAAMAVLCAASLAAPGGAAARRHITCASGTTILANASSRVFEVDPNPRDEFRLGDNYRAYGCRGKRGPVRKLGSFNVDSGARGFRLAGDFVAFDYAVCTHNDCTGNLRVANLASGRVRKSAAFRVGGLPARAIVVTARGAAAWIRPVNDLFEVRKLDSSGEQLLDSGADVDPSSLAASRSSVYWQRSGSVFTAPLS